MKRIIALLLVLVMVLGLFAGCRKNQNDPTEPSQDQNVSVAADENLDKALEYLRVYYKDAPEKTPMDYERLGTVRVGTTSYEIVWSVDVGEDLIKIVKNDDGTVTIDINEEALKEKTEATEYVLTATLTGTDGREVSYSWNHILPAGIDEEALAIIDAAYELEPGQTLDGTHTLTGVIISIDTMYSEEYKNITVTIEVPGREDKPIMCYRLKGEGADKLAIGDTITVTGTLTNYKGTIEFNAGCVLEAVQSGGAPVEVPTDPLEILKAAFALAPGKGLPYKATLTGQIVEVNYPYSAAYGDISVTIVTNGYRVYCFRLEGAGVDQLNVNDVITVNGQLTNYNGTIEFAYPTLLGLTNYAPPSAPSDPTVIVDAAYNLADGDYLPYTATLTGKVTSFKYTYSEAYGSICPYIVIAGRESKPIYCYNLKGNGIKDVEIGDTITVTGDIKNYQGLIEFVYPTLVSVKKGNQVEAPTDPGEILDDAYGLGANETTEYKATLTGKITSIDSAYDPSYGNISVWIEVEGHEDKPVLAYRITGEGANTLAVDDVIKVTGYLTKYVSEDGNIEKVEFVAGSTFEIVEKNTEVVVTDEQKALAAILIEAGKLDNGAYMDEEITVEGVITNNPKQSSYEDSKNSYDFIISDGYNSVRCYFVPVVGCDGAPAKGDTVSVTGKLTAYMGGPQFDKTATATWIKAGDLEPEEPVEEPEDGSTLTIPEANKLGKAFEHDTYTKGKFYVEGEITEISNTDYGNMKIKDAEGNTLYIYGTWSEDGETRFDQLPKQPAVGDTVTVYGKLGQYKDAPQMKNGWLIGYEGKDEEVPDVPVVPDVPAEAPIANGDQVVIYAPAYGKALSTTKTGYYNVGVDVTVTDGVMTGYAETEVFTVVENEDGSYSFAYGEQNLGLADSNSSMDLGAVNDDWTLTDLGDGLYNIQNVGRGNYMEWYNKYSNWSTYNSSSAATDDQFQLSFYIVEKAETEEPDEPVEEGPYKLYLYQANLETGLYFSGEMNGEYLATTEDETLAVDVYTETTDAGMRMYFLDGENKTYIEIYKNDAGKIRPTLVTEPTVYFVFDEAANTYVVDIEGTSYYLGTFNNYNTISASSTYYITGDKAANVGVSQFVAELVQSFSGDDGFELTGPYALYMDQVNLGKALYFSGAMDGEYLATTEKEEEAAQVFIEKNAEGHYRFLTIVGDIFNYIEIYTNANGKVRPTLVTEPTMFYTYSEEAGTYVADINGTDYYLGTYSTYNTISASSTYYITGDKAANVGVSQFLAKFAEIDLSEPTVNGPYILGLYQATNGEALYFTGEMNWEYLATSSDAAAAVEVYTEDTDEGMRMYFLDGETKTYIEIYTNDAGKIRPVLVTEPTVYFVFDEEANTYVVDVEGTNYYLGTFNNYNTISASSTYYITGDNAANVGVSQFVAMLVEDAADLLPEEAPDVPVEPEEPVEMTPAEIVDAAYALEAGAALEGTHTLTGKIVSVDTEYSTQWGNVTVTIAVEGKEDKPIQCYRMKGEGADVIAVGDTITVTGTIKNYFNSKTGVSTIEFDTGCTLDSYEHVMTPAEIVDAAYALEAGASLEGTHTLTGKIVSVDTEYSTQWGNVTVTIAVEGKEDKPIQCYRMKGEGADVIAVGDTIIVTGTIKNYFNSKTGVSTIEFDTGCTLNSYVKAEVVEEDTTVEDTTVEDPTVEDTTVEDTTVEDTTVEDTTVEDTTVEDTTVEDTTVEDTTVEDTPVENPTVENPAVETPEDDMPATG